MGKKRQWKQKKNKPQNVKGAGYSDIVRENANFEIYYKAQRIVPPEDWDQFMTTLRENLPSAFRITNYKGEAKALLDIFKKTYCEELTKLTEDTEEKPFPLPWYPNELGWQLNLSRSSIRKCETLVKLHNFLISETESGYINRQETVSMLPPLLLDVQPHHAVLDMCAAPGSKTAQLIEMIHAGDDPIPTGFVVANDVDNKRCYMLVHQAKRLQSPSFIITNHDATMMPNLRTSGGKVLKYDRILCDVPCGGDGTIRKNFDIWKKWNVGNSNYQHSLQVRVARRGLELLAVGGRMVYSTCSMNPMEDEAVIYHLLKEAEGSVELVDVSESLPGLRVNPGLTTWQVMSKDLEVFEKLEDVPEKYATQIKDYLFPPSPEEAAKHHLTRCFRILPHLQNTGGFFVGVLTKVAPLPWEKKTPEAQETATEPVEAQPESSTEVSKEDPEFNSKNEIGHSYSKKKKYHKGYREDPVVFFKEDELVWPQIRDSYGIDSSFDSTLLMTRCLVGKKKNIYLVGPALKNIITLNSDRLKIINTGMKVFSRCDTKDTKCAFRLTHEGLSTVLPFMKNRIVNINRGDLINLLTNEIPVNSKMSKDTRIQLLDLEGGSIALVYKEEKPDGNSINISLVGWKGVTSLRAYIPKNEKIHFLRIVGADTTKYERNKFTAPDDRKRKRDEENENGKTESAEVKVENREKVIKLSDESSQIETNVDEKEDVLKVLQDTPIQE